MKKGEKVSLGMTWMSYLGSIHGALKAAGMWDGEVHELMGLTGMGFHFITNRTLDASGPTVYNWLEEHFEMLDRIGVYSEQILVFKKEDVNTFDIAKKNNIKRIVTSLDNGIPVVTWGVTPIPEFGIISGYDDKERIFFVEDCMPEEPDPLMYDNLGLCNVPILYLNYLVEKGPYDYDQSVRSSLRFGINHWNSRYPTETDYETGKRAYDLIIRGLEAGRFDPFGLSYLMNVYADLKENMRRFFSDLAERKGFEFIKTVTDDYAELSDLFQSTAKLLPFSGPGGEHHIDSAAIQEIMKKMKAAKQLEDGIMGRIAEALD